MREAERRGDTVATQSDLARMLREVARLVLFSQVLLMAALAATLGVAWYIEHKGDTERDRIAAEADAQRDQSFSLICSVNQGNARDVSDFAGAVVRLIPPDAQPPPSQIVRKVRETAVRVRDNQADFASAKCDSREDLARLLVLIERRRAATTTKEGTP